MKLYEKIAYLRKRKGISQEQFANEVEVSRQTVYKWETGATMPEIDKLKKIAEIFELSYNDLLAENITFSEQTVVSDNSEQSWVKINSANNSHIKPSMSFNLINIIIYACMFLLIIGIIITMTILHNGSNNNDSVIEYAYKITYNNTKDAYNPNATGYNGNEDSFALSALSATGYIFDGWYIDNERVTEIKTSLNSDITLHAKWTPYEYSILFTDPQNTSETFTLTYNVESKEIILPVPSVSEKYNFIGWYENGKKIESIPHGSIGNITLVAKWEACEYNITYIGIEGCSNSNPTKYKFNNGTVKLSSPTKAGHTFLGWYLDENYEAKLTQISNGTTGDITLYARWIEGEYVAIFTASDLKNISMKSNYILANDIDLNGEEWTPLGTYISPYKGIFNGNGYIISNFKITLPYRYVGLFGYNKGTIKNLGIENFEINISDNIEMDVGGLVGFDYYGTISNCFANGNITVSSLQTAAGILIGNTVSSTITSCHSSGNINITCSTYNNVGGLVGWCGAVNMSKCYSTATVYSVADSSSEERAAASAGGLIGGASGIAAINNPGGTITDCYATGNVTAVAKATVASTSAEAGGFIGSSGGVITNCYATGNVYVDTCDTKNINGGGIYANATAGGFAGGADKLVNCFATGDVSAKSVGWSNVAGLVNDGMYNGESINCYRNSSQKVEYKADEFGSVKTHGTSKALSNMLTEDFYKEILGWSLDVWIIDDGNYPTLK